VENFSVSLHFGTRLHSKVLSIFEISKFFPTRRRIIKRNLWAKTYSIGSIISIQHWFVTEQTARHNMYIPTLALSHAGKERQFLCFLPQNQLPQNRRVNRLISALKLSHDFTFIWKKTNIISNTYTCVTFCLYVFNTAMPINYKCKKLFCWCL